MNASKAIGSMSQTLRILTFSLWIPGMGLLTSCGSSAGGSGSAYPAPLQPELSRAEVVSEEVGSEDALNPNKMPSEAKKDVNGTAETSNTSEPTDSLPEETLDPLGEVDAPTSPTSTESVVAAPTLSQIEQTVDDLRAFDAAGWQLFTDDLVNQFDVRFFIAIDDTNAQALTADYDQFVNNHIRWQLLADKASIEEMIDSGQIQAWFIEKDTINLSLKHRAIDSSSLSVQGDKVVLPAQNLGYYYLDVQGSGF